MEKPKTRPYSVAPGLWMELPIKIGKREKAKRIKEYLDRLNQPVYQFNPKAQ